MKLLVGIPKPYDRKVNLAVGTNFANASFICICSHVISSDAKPAIRCMPHEAKGGRLYAVCTSDLYFDILDRRGSGEDGARQTLILGCCGTGTRVRGISDVYFDLSRWIGDGEVVLLSLLVDVH